MAIRKEEVLDELMAITDKLGHFPTIEEVKQMTDKIDYYDILANGGMKNLAFELGYIAGVGRKRDEGNIKKEQITFIDSNGNEREITAVERNGRIQSRAFQIEREQRKIGKSYGDYQAEQTLELVGRIDLSQYGIKED